MNAALTRLQTRAESDPKAKEKLDSLAPLIQSLEEAEQRLRERNTKKSQRGADEKKADSGKKAATPTAPSVGEVRRGYRYNGGDPSKPTSWSKV
jgi:septal ring factor EnvC (AmiA/AmiB activator)